ncbi:hypothetical protein ACFY0R_10080 [Streptomyces sp. NPDC001633]|uniref:hypothetical protein n=1 Tax=Streptomyces sp. NPDC001633 TaxID=3364595 RepID=UPI0036B49D15
MLGTLRRNRGVEAGEVVFVDDGKLIAKLSQLVGTAAITLRDCGLVVAIAPVGGVLQELVQCTQGTPAVAEDSFGNGMELRGGAGTVQLVSPCIDAGARLGQREGVGELSRVVVGPAEQIVRGGRVGLVGIGLFGGSADVVVQLEVGVQGCSYDCWGSVRAGAGWSRQGGPGPLPPGRRVAAGTAC